MEDIYIGEWTGYMDSHLITLNDFLAEIKSGTYWTLEQYCDGRVHTNLCWFNYDPFTGKKISKHAVKSYVEEKLKYDNHISK